MQGSLISTLSIGLMVLGMGGSFGQSYPNRPIRLVTSEHGGSTDFAARLVAQGLTGSLGQPVIVENRGGGGAISGEIVTKAAPDGYTMLVTGGSFWLAPLMRKTSYDPVRGFSPITLVVNSPNVIVVHPSVPIKSVQDLIDLAKGKPGEINYATSGIGSSPHLAAELLKAMTGINIVRINYKGGGQVITAVLGGEVQVAFPAAVSAATHVKSGKLRAVAVTSARPSALFPGVPSVAATVPGYGSGGATAIFAPPRTSATLIKRLNQEIVQILNRTDVKEKFFSVGSEVAGSSPEQLAATINSEMARMSKVIKDAGIRSD